MNGETPRMPRASLAVNRVLAHNDLESPSDHGPEEEIQKYEDFWFADGTITLVARDVQFRVYKGILARHSTVFADMFAFPQPRASDHLHMPSEPSVVILTDSPEDLRHVLRVLFPSKRCQFIHVRAELPTFPMISAYARLGHKYQIDGLVNQALDFLKDRFTNDFNLWCQRRSSEELPDSYVPPMWEDVHAIGVVNIARLIHCDVILPTALAVCCTLRGEQLVKGFAREDGSQETLSSDDLARCVEGKGAIMLEATAGLLRAFSPRMDEPGTPSHAFCQERMQSLFRGYTPQQIADVHPFRDDFYSLKVLHAAFSICGQCAASLRNRVLEEKRALWGRLPEVLGVAVEGCAAQL